ncbi:MAG: hypothetical protein WC542_07930 [Paludibacter sp.]
MEIKFNDKPITIKTLEIDGKKLTKNFIQQIEIEYFDFLKKDVKNKSFTFSLAYLDKLVQNTSDYKLNGQLIGYINTIFKDNIPKSMPFEEIIPIEELYTIIFINNYNQLRRGYIRKLTYNKVFGFNSTQLFI